MPLVEALIRYDRHDRRRFHVPAHAGQNLSGFNLLADPFRYDLTELDGLDVLSEPSGPIAETQALMAEVFGVAHSFMLINGASVGLMAAMLSLVQPGDKVLVARNVHRAVLSGLILTGAHPVWFLPDQLAEWGLWGGVSVEQVHAQLTAHPDVKALFITAPTYEGIGSDTAAIAQCCRNAGVALVVDEAHGSLWPLTSELPQSACHSGADLVIHSLHKSGGSLTQGALAHLPANSRVDADIFQQALNTLQTTSPSYLLMASLESTCAFLGSTAGQARIQQLLGQVGVLRQHFKQKLTQLRLYVPPEENLRFWDPCKFYFSHPLECGEDWGARLEIDPGIAYESANPSGVLYLANIGLSDSDFKAFQQMILYEDQRIPAFAGPSTTAPELEVCLPEIVMPPRNAFFALGETVAAHQAPGRIAKETVVHCPPGIPVLMPGERIQAYHLPLLPEAGVMVVS
ncbi:aminotransferase class I/II-fold pyridoxal phosphate-dependent enzyme [Vampirovibrio sp.]|uniref:aminotransferase class I/II-fold pyridoxal phosphate-dependent enzyme n=1 Tax=Vampirovibrio sp. TaxID=2717857 RepID=UPI0035939173